MQSTPLEERVSLPKNSLKRRKIEREERRSEGPFSVSLTRSTGVSLT
jgi:hypothetical protein